MKKSLIASLLLSVFSVLPPAFASDPDENRSRVFTRMSATWDFLEDGDEVAIIFPSAGPLSPEHLEAMKDFIRQNNLVPFIPEESLDKEAGFGYYAHSHEGRLKAIRAALD